MKISSVQLSTHVLRDLPEGVAVPLHEVDPPAKVLEQAVHQLQLLDRGEHEKERGRKLNRWH